MVAVLLQVWAWFACLVLIWRLNAITFGGDRAYPEEGAVVTTSSTSRNNMKLFSYSQEILHPAQHW